jgi:sugar O-acyltransferase (sialic acid O-acetyltransferase NeuD family)
MEEIKKEGVYLYGASGHGKVVAEIAESISVKLKGFIDDDPSLEKVWDYPVYQELPNDVESLVLSLGNNLTRKKLAKKYAEFPFQTLIHSNSTLSKRAEVGEGTVVMAGVTVNADAEIGKHCILNTNASIDHDCQLEDFVHISPNAALAGNVWVGEGTHIGIGASVIQGIKIGRWSMVGAGAVVIEDVPEFAVVVGNPAKVLKFQTELMNKQTHKQ